MVEFYNQERVRDYKATDVTVQLKFDKWTKIVLQQIAAEFQDEVEFSITIPIIIKAAINDLIRKYEYKNSLDFMIEDQQIYKDYRRLKRAYKKLRLEYQKNCKDDIIRDECGRFIPTE